MSVQITMKELEYIKEKYSLLHSEHEDLKKTHEKTLFHLISMQNENKKINIRNKGHR